MSYCVNCGVELEASLGKCPLCGTKVLNPNEMKEEKNQTFPRKRGEVESVSHKDVIVLFSVIMLTISATCGLLNGLVYNTSRWSVPVIGVCMVFWIFFMAAVFARKITVYSMIFLDVLALGIYLWMISYITASNEWFYQVAIPILCVTAILTEIVVMMGRKLPLSLLTGTLYFFVAIAILCASIEIILDLFLYGEISLSWSAIVLTVSAIISVALITILMTSRLRNTVNRRLHF